MTENNNGNGSRQVSKTVFLATIFLGSLTGAIGFLAISAVWLGGPFSEQFLHAHGVIASPPPTELTAKQIYLMNDLVKSGTIVRTDQIISTLVSYYESVITVLVSVLGVLGVLAFMYVKAVSIEHAEREVDVITEKKMSGYLGSVQFKEEVSNSASEIIKFEIGEEKELIKSYIDDLETERERRDKLEFRQREIIKSLEAIEAAIAKSDDSEQDDGEAQIEEVD